MNINWYPGHMAKTKKQIAEDLKLIDVVIELLDARIPLSSMNPNIAELVKQKKKIIVLNKSDLSDEKENNKWINYFHNNGISAILTDSNSGKGINNVIKEIEDITKEETIKNANKGRVGKSTRVMVLGIPNVGKSSFINRISKKATMAVGNRPGVTRSKQWIKISNNIELLDTPGVLWTKIESEEVALNLAYIGTIKDDILQRVDVAFFLLKYLLNNYMDNVIERYKLDADEMKKILAKEDENSNILEIMHYIGRKRGAIVSGGNIDEEKTAGLILDDFRSGKIGKITLERIEN